MAEEDGFVERVSKEHQPKSFVIAEVNKMSKIYLSTISSSTLTKELIYTIIHDSNVKSSCNYKKYVVLGGDYIGKQQAKL